MIIDIAKNNKIIKDILKLIENKKLFGLLN
jgi:hypothetical protein